LGVKGGALSNPPSTRSCEGGWIALLVLCEALCPPDELPKTLADKGLTVIERAPVAEGAKLRWVVHPKSSSGVLVELT
jgi:hypothetical protein